MAGKLWIVGTPIGNLSDLSPRAAEVLGAVDFIAAEDTRVTLKLLNHLGIKKPMISYFEHNRDQHGEIILERIRSGENCALVSDAGMPGISDPGERLAALCERDGIEVSAVPGPTAAVTALVLSGLPTGRFTFEGFLSVNKRERRGHLLSLIKESRTMIFYEAPHKLRKTLDDLKDTFGPDRKIALCRELTKIHEEVLRTTLSAAAEKYSTEEPRGEFVLVVEGIREKTEDENGMTAQEAVILARKLVKSGLSPADAAKEAAKLSGVKRGEIYKGLID